ncbi:serine/threonine-protein kinase [Actinacidiphila acidipaludis]|uniref:non-specific serine/threonine protein kinase n=1 Tax=Actinacidiphila acidipaludis TaxID=2873382 RepID=A0ABS7QF60_9ACTN|nr:serine/threonine-protein kinase [Streptomyces acidipaludis]MBY8881796.1 serine/threonine protein kinase [Streptomyces acidipaludis]
MVGQVDEGRLVAGRYRLLERIGRGGMGTVWRAEDELLGRQVAVKKLHPPQPHMEDDELATLFERTRREARAAARISHPNVIVVHDVVDDAGLPSIVMEYVPSMTLGELLKERGALPVDEVARIGRGMIAALRAAHAAGVLHRDVKPGNVLLGEAAGDGQDQDGAGRGRVVLTDFGIAQASGTSTLTRTGELIGSIDFLSPERIRGAMPGPEADLWALGATLYQAVEGSSPFRRPTAIETAYAIAEEPVAPARNAGALTQVIAGLLAKEPEQRLSAEQAERMLRSLAADEDTALVGRYTKGSAGQEAPTAVVPHPRGPVAPSPYGPAGHPAYGTGPQSPYGTGRQQPHGTAVQPPYGAGGPPPYDTGSGRQPHPPRRRRRVTPWLAAAAVVVVLAAGAAFAVRQYVGTSGDPQAGPTTGPVTTGGPAATPTTTAPATPTTPLTTPPPPVPDGYHLVSMPSRGYSVPVPEGWHRQVAEGGDQMDYIDPTGKVDLKISALEYGSTSPLEHWKNLEPQTRHQVGPTYHRERLDPTEQFGEPAAIWEFTFQGTSRKFHAIDLGFGKPGGTEYAVYLSAPDAVWEQYRPVFDNAVAGFRLSAG